MAESEEPKCLPSTQINNGSKLQLVPNASSHVILRCMSFKKYVDFIDGILVHCWTNILMSSKSKNTYIIFLAVFASLNSVMVGYCIGAISGAVIFISEDLAISEHQEEILMAAFVLVSVVGNIVAGQLADVVGRRNTMAFAAIVCFIGSIIMGIAPSYNILLTGRLLSGISLGSVYVIVPLYIAEVSPPEIRGTLISVPEISLNFGILLGYLSGYLLSGLPSDMNWRIMLSLGAFPAILLGFGLPYMPESPRWLVIKGRQADARQFLVRISRDKEDADQRLKDILIAAYHARRNNLDPDENFRNDKSPSNDLEHNILLLDSEIIKRPKLRSFWSEILMPNAATRRVLVISMAFQFFNQASGIPAVLYYSPAIFAAAGIDGRDGDLGSTVIVGLSKTIFVLVATMFVDRAGRRFLLLISGVGMSASMAILGAAFLMLNNSIPNLEFTVPTWIIGITALFSTCSFVAFFSIGFGPICNLLIAELFPLRIRAQGMSLSIVMNRSIGGLISLYFLTVANAITPAGLFLIFALISAVSVLFVYTLVPETTGKSLEEIH